MSGPIPGQRSEPRRRSDSWPCPKSSRSAPRDTARQSDVAEVRDELRQAREEKPEAKEEERRSLVGAAFAMAAPMAWRFAQNYAAGLPGTMDRPAPAAIHGPPGPRPGGPQGPGQPSARASPADQAGRVTDDTRPARCRALTRRVYR